MTTMDQQMNVQQRVEAMTKKFPDRPRTAATYAVGRGEEYMQKYANAMDKDEKDLFLEKALHWCEVSKVLVTISEK